MNKMANPLFNAMNKMGGGNPMLAALQNFRSQMERQANVSPQQMVQQLLNNGQMSQEQFNNLQAQAKQIMSMMNLK